MAKWKEFNGQNMDNYLDQSSISSPIYSFSSLALLTLRILTYKHYIQRLSCPLTLGYEHPMRNPGSGYKGKRRGQTTYPVDFFPMRSPQLGVSLHGRSLLVLQAVSSFSRFATLLFLYPAPVLDLLLINFSSLNRPQLRQNIKALNQVTLPQVPFLLSL